MKRQAVKGCISLKSGLVQDLKGLPSVLLQWDRGIHRGACTPAALLLLPPKLPDVPACAGGCQAGLQLLRWPPLLQARSPQGSSH